MSSRCRSYARIDQASVPVYVPKNVCPEVPNTDPRRFDAYIKPKPCLSQPLSHSEYLRKLVANNGRAIGGGVLKQSGDGDYVRTDWMNTDGNCVLPNVPVPAAQPFVQAGLTELKNGYAAARGTISKHDTTNRTAEITTLKRAGLAIKSSEGCTTCTLSGSDKPTPNCHC